MAEYDQRQTSDDGYGERGLPEGGYQPDGNQDGAYGLPPAAGPSRKRPRMDGTEAVGAQQRQPSTRARNQAAQPIIPSLFGIAPRNDLTKKVGEFIMRHARGLDQVEVRLPHI